MIQGSEQSVEIDDVGMDLHLGHVLVEAVGLAACSYSSERQIWHILMNGSFQRHGENHLTSSWMTMNDHSSTETDGFADVPL